MDALDTPYKEANPATTSNNHLALRWGGILGGVSILLTLVGYLTGFDPGHPDASTATKAIMFLISISATVWGIYSAIAADRTQLGGFMSNGRGAMLGLKVGAISSILGGLFMILYMKVINPGYMDTLKEGMMAKFEQQGMSESDAEAAMQMAGSFMNPVFLLASSIIGGIITGLLIGLIVSAVTKRA